MEDITKRRSCPFCDDNKISQHLVCGERGFVHQNVCGTCHARGPEYKESEQAHTGWDARS